VRHSQVRTHLTLHLVDLLEDKHALTNNTPGFVGIGIIVYDLGSDHECRDEEVVTRGTASGYEPCLESLQ